MEITALHDLHQLLYQLQLRLLAHLLLHPWEVMYLASASLFLHAINLVRRALVTPMCRKLSWLQTTRLRFKARKCRWAFSRSCQARPQLPCRESPRGDPFAVAFLLRVLAGA